MRKSPDCIGACESQVCGPLSEVIDVWYTGGGEDYIKRVVCRHAEAFDCLVSPEKLPKCSSMLAKAADLGFAVPRTAAALSATCSAPGGNQDLSPNATNATTAVTTTAAGGTCSLAASLACEEARAPELVSRRARACAGAGCRRPTGGLSRARDPPPCANDGESELSPENPKP